jgi:hypothetical protein
MKDFNSPKGGDDFDHNALLSPPSGKLKTVVLNKCDFCQIGIGTSMLFDRGTWREYKHSCKKAREFKWRGGIMRVCDDCYETLMSKKEPAKFIKQSLKGTKDEI